MAQLVEHNLAKVGVAGSSPVVRSIAFPDRLGGPFSAKWPSGKAEACKAFTPGSNPGFASRQHPGAPAPVLFYICGHGSVGRAQPCQGWGRGFEPRCPLQTQQPDYYGSRAFSYPSLGLEPERERAFWGVAVTFAANVRFGRIIVGISQNLVARETHPMATEKSSSRPWMSDAAIYQIYPRSFKDSTGSGLGDIAGITQQMDYLERLGIEAIWLSPFYPSPLVDGGYDVADYCDVDPRLGSLDDFDDMIAAAHTHGIKVIVDIVPNHSSNQHPWFKAALAAGPGSPERARYIFRDGRGEHGELPPTNWNANFGDPAWTRVADGQWYLHMFTPEQPDFDWSCPEVHAFFCDVLAFWSDRGVDGFRIDVAHGLAKDLDRDDLDRWHLAEGDDMVEDGTHPLWDRNEVHEIYREWRRVFDRYDPPRSAVAEAWVLPERQYLYARPSELGQTFNFEFAKATWTYDDMHAAIEKGLKAAIESDSASTWVLSNHDVPRVATRYALPQIKATRYHQIALDWLLRDGSSYDEDRELGERRARAALLLELALPGSAYVYQGEELGLFEVADIPWAALEDPTATNTHGPKREKGRDGCRVPLPWVAADDPAQGGSFGFSPADADAAPHLPQPAWFSDYAADREEADPTSMLALYRDALWLRRKLRGCANDLAWLDLDGRTGLADGAEGAEGGVIAYRRDNGWACVTNFGAAPVELPAGRVLLTSSPLADGRLAQDSSAWIMLAEL